MLTVTPNQRGALLYACDYHVVDWDRDRSIAQLYESPDPDDPDTPDRPTAEVILTVIDNLIRPDADGEYAIDIPRADLLVFLKHERKISEETMHASTFAIWFSCVTLLGSLGLAQPEGDIYAPYEMVL